MAADLFRRAPGRRTTLLLSAAAVAVATAVLLLMASMVVAVDSRAARQAWWAPAASDRPVATQRTTTAYLDHRQVTVVHLAPVTTDHGVLPAPPGMNRFPGPGEIALSPALDSRLGGRGETLGLGAPSGTTTLGEEAYGGPDDLVAVVGHRPGDPATTMPAFSSLSQESRYTGPVGIDGFTGKRDAAFVDIYGPSSVLAAAMLVVPVLGLMSAAAGLGAQARAQKFARLRLAGASGGLLRRLVAVESAVLSGTGVLAGIFLHLAIIPVAARISMAGSRFEVGDLIVPVRTVLMVAALVALLMFLRVKSLTRAAIRRPLATAEALPTTLPLWWRIGLAAASIGVFLVARAQDDQSLGLILVVLLMIFGAVAVLGPIGVLAYGRILLSRRSAADLIAGRRLVAAPRAAWRPIAGVAMSCFVAGFFALMAYDPSTVVHGRAGTVDMTVPAQSADATQAAVDRALKARGVPLAVTRERGSSGTMVDVSSAGASRVTLRVDEDSAAVRSAMQEAAPGAPMASGADLRDGTNVYLSDIRRGSVFVLVISFILAAATMTVTAITGISERKDVFRRLRAAGTPVETLLSARRRETFGPLVLCASAAAASGFLLAAPFMLFGGSLSWNGPAWLAAGLGGGLLVSSLALNATAGRLRRESRP
ncbi:hypothetical protein AUCHE_06_00160 [Austwickia chelonae NBRC 105200]|uniref:ABC3 transporter permease protein domain-containing protein n=2 Tax=Austwickia TaxID=1184606 RepID=K6VLY2_9MICO|nr:hypothetical protein AUCHE_06_00160 [Austwickia chelonae NBRC 105200]